MSRLAAISLLVLALPGLSTAQSKCYYPNGQEAKYPNGAGASTNYPCDPTAETSVCCGGEVGVVCLSNKLCVGPMGNTIRGSCTDQNWDSPDCPLYCMGAVRGGTDLISCSNVTKTDTSYCCDGHRAFCCDEGVARFEVFPSNPEIVARWDPSATAFVPVARPSTSSSPPQQSDTTSSSSSTATDAQTTQSDQSSSTTTTPAPTSNPAQDQDQDQDSPREPASSSGLSVGAQAGIGVGAGVLGLALIAVAFLLYKLRKKKARLAELERQQQQQQNMGAAGHQELEVKYDQNGAPMAWYPYQQQQQYPPAELGGALPTREMDGTGLRAELDSQRGWVVSRT